MLVVLKRIPPYELFRILFIVFVLTILLYIYICVYYQGEVAEEVMFKLLACMILGPALILGYAIKIFFYYYLSPNKITFNKETKKLLENEVRLACEIKEMSDEKIIVVSTFRFFIFHNFVIYKNFAKI